MDRQYQSVPYVLQPAHGGGHGGSHAAGYIAHVDPRLRILTAAAASVLIAAAQQFAVLGAALAAAVVAWTLSGLSPRTVLKRLLPLNLVLLLLAVLLPLSTRGTPLVEFSSLSFSQEGVLLATTIALKGNAILLTLLVLLGTMDATTLGHALNHLHVPDKLTHLLLFTVRYVDVLHRESLRLRAAMRVRGFRPRVNLHTYRSYGHLVGMLLVRSFDRAERIVAAMKCRGFRGHFYLLDHFAMTRADLPFAAAAAAVLLALGLWEWA
jgi:cobalt/nickel transport system permease protein